jgi:hypothetical protein
MLIPVLKRFESLMLRSEVPVSIDAYFVPRETDHRLFCELVSISRTVTNTHPQEMDTTGTRQTLNALHHRLKEIIKRFDINALPQLDLQATAVFLDTGLDAQLPSHALQRLFKDTEEMLLKYRQPRDLNDIHRSLWGLLTGLLWWGEYTLQFENNLVDTETVRVVILNALKALLSHIRSDIHTECNDKITAAIRAITTAEISTLQETIHHATEQCRMERRQYNHDTDQTAYRELHEALRSIHLRAVGLVPLDDEDSDDPMDEDRADHMRLQDREALQRVQTDHMHPQDKADLQRVLEPLLSRFSDDGQPSMAMHCVAVFLKAAIELPLSGRSRLSLLAKIDDQLREHNSTSDSDDPFFELLIFTDEILDWGESTLQYEANQDRVQVRSVLVQVLHAVLSRMPSLVAYACKKKIEDAVQTIRHATADTLLRTIERAHTECRGAILPYYSPV